MRQTHPYRVIKRFIFYNKNSRIWAKSPEAEGTDQSNFILEHTPSKFRPNPLASPIFFTWSCDYYFSMPKRAHGLRDALRHKRERRQRGPCREHENR
jgi:hypothetical protein